jgi:L-arabinose isomerase
MIDLSNLKAWFVTGSKHLYGPETLKKVEQHATDIARMLAASPEMPVKIIAKPVMPQAQDHCRLLAGRGCSLGNGRLAACSLRL